MGHSQWKRVEERSKCFPSTIKQKWRQGKTIPYLQVKAAVSKTAESPWVQDSTRWEESWGCQGWWLEPNAGRAPGAAGLLDGFLEMLIALALGSLGKHFTAGWVGSRKASRAPDSPPRGGRGEWRDPYCESEISVLKRNQFPSESFTTAIQVSHCALEEHLLIAIHYIVSIFVSLFYTLTFVSKHQLPHELMDHLQW